jgi:hypothetical protein
LGELDAELFDLLLVRLFDLANPEVLAIFARHEERDVDLVFEIELALRIAAYVAEAQASIHARIALQSLSTTVPGEVRECEWQVCFLPLLLEVLLGLCDVPLEGNEDLRVIGPLGVIKTLPFQVAMLHFFRLLL